MGDLATENDAARLARSQAPVKQIITGTLCHLEAAMVQNAVNEERWDLGQLDFLFIENVGNLVCPSSYDLGEDLRVVLLSVTEGEDKPLKYPTIFNSADVAIVTKSDLAAAVEFDWEATQRNIQAVRPGMRVFQLSAKTGDGMQEYLEFLADDWLVANHGRSGIAAVYAAQNRFRLRIKIEDRKPQRKRQSRFQLEYSFHQQPLLARFCLGERSAETSTSDSPTLELSGSGDRPALSSAKEKCSFTSMIMNMRVPRR